MSNPVRNRARLRRATVLMLAALVAVPTAVATATPSTGPGAAAAAGSATGEAPVALPDDPVEADLGGAIGSLDAWIKSERTQAEAAAQAVAAAQDQLEAADAALARVQQRLDQLVTDTGAVAASVLLGAGTAAPDAPPKAPKGKAEPQEPAPGASSRSVPPVLALPLAADPEAVELLRETREQLAAEADKRAQAQAEARERARRAQAARAEAEAAAAQKAKFLQEAQERLTEEMEEAESVGDSERRAEVKARLDEVVAIIEAPKRAAAARKAKEEAAAKAQAGAKIKAADAAAKAKAKADAAARAKAAAAMTPQPVGPPTGAYPSVRCPGGGSITVDGSLAHNLNAMLLVAWNDGVNLCGGGYRDPDQQIRLRIQNCGSSSYAIYQAPSSSCSPPTAVPGTSDHERGLAIDFRCAGRGIPSRSSPCYQWLAARAASFGLFNLPSEPWHWSVDGS
jgi:hypothetical protein